MSGGCLRLARLDAAFRTRVRNRPAALSEIALRLWPPAPFPIPSAPLAAGETVREIEELSRLGEASQRQRATLLQ